MAHLFKTWKDGEEEEEKRSRRKEVAFCVAGAKRSRKNFGPWLREMNADSRISHFLEQHLQKRCRTTRINISLSDPGMLPQTRLSRVLVIRNSYIATSTYIHQRSLLPNPCFAERRFTTSSPARDEDEPKPRPARSKPRYPVDTCKLDVLSDEQYQSLKTFENACKRP